MSLLDRYDVLIAIDTEYAHGRDINGMPHDENAVVSYQASFFDPRTGRKGSGIVFTKAPHRRHRISLTAFLSRVINAIHADGIDLISEWKADMASNGTERNLRIAIVSHFSRADLPGFSDFKRMKQSFDGVRGTFCTMQNPAVRELVAPDGTRFKASLTLLDTKLLAPAGAASLRALGDLVGLPKLTLPCVIDEYGNSIPGIERMDLTAQQHPKEFAAYAKRDCEVCIEYIVAFAQIAEEWDATKIPSTIASMAVRWLLDQYQAELCAMTGRTPDRNGRPSDFLPEAAAIQTLAADAYHGGRNEAFAHGIFNGTPERPFTDFDLRGAYTSAMAEFREADWAALEHTRDIARLAQLDDPAVAAVDFTFPPETRFPSLPVNTGDGGLVYPLSGSTTATGPELLVALNQGARFTVRAGVRVPWLEPDANNATLPFAALAAFVNAGRARHPKKSVPELIFKEGGNSAYGKLGQGVGVMKSKPETLAVFDTRTGSRRALEPSKITSPILAAMTSGLVRAVLSEILANLPPHVRVLSATTDGWLSDCTQEEAEAASQGPVCRHFAKLRARVSPDGSDEILEIKHQALSVLVARTRHGVTITPHGASKPILARAGHRLPQDFDGDTAAECAAFVQLQRDRQHNTKLPVSSFLSLPRQWEHASDLLEVHRMVAVSLDYDMKREPIDPKDHDGLIQFTTRPWDALPDCLSARDDIGIWRNAAHTVLKTATDWRAFSAWRQGRRQQSFAARSPFQNAVITAWAKGLGGLERRTGTGRLSNASQAPLSMKGIAAFLTDAGIVGVTRDTLRDAKRREPDPRGSVTCLLDGDLELAQRLLEHTTLEALEELMAPGSKSAFDSLRVSGNPNWGKIPLLRFQWGKCPYAMTATQQGIENKSDLAIFHDTKKNGGIGLWGEGALPPFFSSATTPENTPPETVNPTPSDIAHALHMKALAQRRYGITRARLERAEKIARANLTLTPRQRLIAPLIIAIGQKLQLPPADAAVLVGELTQETAPDDE